jgi:hypothetical protein
MNLPKTFIVIDNFQYEAHEDKKNLNNGFLLKESKLYEMN